MEYLIDIAGAVVGLILVVGGLAWLLLSLFPPPIIRPNAPGPRQMPPAIAEVFDRKERVFLDAAAHSDTIHAPDIASRFRKQARLVRELKEEVRQAGGWATPTLPAQPGEGET